GPNGAGKTTLMYTLSGVLPVYRGKIILDGKDITRLSPEKRVRQGIAVVPQGRTVFPYMTVKENLEMGAYGSKDRSGFEEAYELFPVLKERMSQLAGTLSGGEQKMLEIARALMSKPKLLLLDEPSLGLAPRIIDILFSTISKYSREKNLALLIAEQNIYKTLKICRRAYVMNVGRIMAEGSSEEFMQGDRLSRLYLGEAV
ncbi:MAG: ABC transporter ATP-binding protein, partial [Candidatus Caldarchaeum sp.]|nr:ABC transporter ATP-binding protein [Candidatus Caldarchaeum sp.]MDW8360653.1 ABC transporter ATP-binding protein [Candidatus Caldarchaeum sp.]